MGLWGELLLCCYANLGEAQSHQRVATPLTLLMQSGLTSVVQGGALGHPCVPGFSPYCLAHE